MHYRSLLPAFERIDLLITMIRWGSSSRVPDISYPPRHDSTCNRRIYDKPHQSLNIPNGDGGSRLPIQIVNGSDTILTTARKTAVKIAAIATNKPSSAAEIPATRATMTPPITLITAAIKPTQSAHPKLEIPAMAGITTTTIAQSNIAASNRMKAIYYQLYRPSPKEVHSSHIRIPGNPTPPLHTSPKLEKSPLSHWGSVADQAPLGVRRGGVEGRLGRGGTWLVYDWIVPSAEGGNNLSCDLPSRGSASRAEPYLPVRRSQTWHYLASQHTNIRPSTF